MVVVRGLIKLYSRVYSNVTLHAMTDWVNGYVGRANGIELFRNRVYTSDQIDDRSDMVILFC